MARLGSLLLCLALISCKSRDEALPEPPTAPSAARASEASAAKVRIVPAPATDEPVADIVKRELGAAQAAGRTLVVYVGAVWCEPCQHFHRAAEAGRLDAEFPKLTLLEFDADRDGARLGAAGFRSRYIPLFAIPTPAGGMARSMEGSIKGEGAVAEITPRLHALIEGRR